MRLTLAFLLVGTPALAEGLALTEQAFEEAVTGRTFFYDHDGTPFGAEQYLPGRRVVWAFTGDDCLKGAWFGHEDQICFTYEGKGAVQCWRFHLSDKGLVAYPVESGGLRLIARQSSPEPMRCLGPDVGA